MSDFQKSIITPESIAERLAAAANLSDPSLAALIAKEPRLIEMLWFLQWASMQPGSIEKFAADTVDQLPAMFGPAIIHHDSAKITAKQRLAIWECAPKYDRLKIAPHEAWYRHDNEPQALTERIYHDEAYQPSERESALLQSTLAKVAPQQFRELFLTGAKAGLAKRIYAICNAPGKALPDAIWNGKDWPDPTGQPWWCEDLCAVLFKAMDLHASRAAAQLAQTEVVSTVFETLEFAWSSKVLVQIEGSSRFGKTESVRAWCNANPGKARLIATPGTTLDKDIYRAVAESLGIQFSYGRKSGLPLREKVEYVIRHGSLMFVFDEAHFLLPQRITATTLPTRLNWTRCQIVDRKLPVAIVTTPQTFSHAVNRFTRATGYNFEQFLGRIAHTATLPDAVCREDLLAIAKFYAPDLPAVLQKFVVVKAEQKESYIKAVENIISLARWNAGRAGRKVITLEDLDAAASGRIHGQPAPPVPPVAPSQRRQEPFAP